jgi:hypothetical protein
MSQVWLLRTTVGVGVAAAALVSAGAAWAADPPTHPVLHQHDQHILASAASFKQGFGSCDVQQGTNEDVWVFVWPGGSAAVGTVTDVQIGWDTDGDGTVDTTRSLAMGSPGVDPLDNGTPKVAFVTPAGWRLESGTSTITGKVSTFDTNGFAEGFFNLTHACPGTSTTPAPTTPAPTTPAPTTSAPTSAPPTSHPGETLAPSSPPVRTTGPVGTTPGGPPTTETSPAASSGGLPITGAALGGLITTGLGLVAGGVALLVARRRRDNAEA